MTRPDREMMPYRDCAGIVLFNRQGQVFMGKRTRNPAADQGDQFAPWQWPQGGIDAGEEPEAAALRELAEETSVISAKLIGRAPDLVRYDLPDDVLGRALEGKYRGQQQQWFATLLTSNDSEINVLSPLGSTFAAEFDGWKWVALDQAVDLVVPFKRPVYQQVAAAFADLPQRIRDGEL